MNENSTNDDRIQTVELFLSWHRQRSETCPSGKWTSVLCPCEQIRAFICADCGGVLGPFFFKGDEPCEHVDVLVETDRFEVAP